MVLVRLAAPAERRRGTSHLGNRSPESARRPWSSVRVHDGEAAMQGDGLRRVASARRSRRERRAGCAAGPQRSRFRNLPRPKKY
jgi:hypothetical protein